MSNSGSPSAEPEDYPVIYGTVKNPRDRHGGQSGKILEALAVSVCLTCYYLDKGGGLNNGDFPERIERQQVVIPGHDQISPAIPGQFKKFVVFGVAALCNPFGNCYQFCCRQQP